MRNEMVSQHSKLVHFLQVLYLSFKKEFDIEGVQGKHNDY